MSRSSSSSSSEVEEDFVPCEQPGIKIEGEDEAEYSLQPYLFEPTRKLSSSDENSGENESESEGDSGSASDESRLNDLEW